MIVRVNVVLNMTVVADSDWRFDNHCKSIGTVRNVLRNVQTRGARDGAVVRALASHQCGPGSNPRVDAICGLSLLLILSFAPRGFSPGTPVFLSPQKPTFPHSNSTRDQVDEEPLCGCSTSKSLFIYLKVTRTVQTTCWRENGWKTDNVTNDKRLFSCDNRRIEIKRINDITSLHSQSRLNRQTTNNIAA